MEVKNPLYQDEPTPATPHPQQSKGEDEDKSAEEKTPTRKEKVAAVKEDSKGK